MMKQIPVDIEKLADSAVGVRRKVIILKTNEGTRKMD
jgi:hypothetical protein